MKKVFCSSKPVLVICFCTLKSIAQSSDEKVRAVIQKAEDAWNAHDYSFTGKYDIYAEDAVLVNPVGMYWKNRSQIRQRHAAVWSNNASAYIHQIQHQKHSLFSAGCCIGYCAQH
jgi:ketosteroid isomerase-like protein